MYINKILCKLHLSYSSVSCVYGLIPKLDTCAWDETCTGEMCMLASKSETHKQHLSVYTVCSRDDKGWQHWSWHVHVPSTIAQNWMWGCKKGGYEYTCMHPEHYIVVNCMDHSESIQTLHDDPSVYDTTLHVQCMDAHAEFTYQHFGCKILFAPLLASSLLAKFIIPTHFVTYTTLADHVMNIKYSYMSVTLHCSEVAPGWHLTQYSIVVKGELQLHDRTLHV